MRVSLSSFEEGRRVLCETAWLAGEPCQAAVVPRIVEVAASREAAREEAREPQGLTTLVYLMVSSGLMVMMTTVMCCLQVLGLFYIVLAAILVATTITRTRYL